MPAQSPRQLRERQNEHAAALGLARCCCWRPVQASAPPSTWGPQVGCDRTASRDHARRMPMGRSARSEQLARLGRPRLALAASKAPGQSRGHRPGSNALEPAGLLAQVTPVEQEPTRSALPTNLLGACRIPGGAANSLYDASVLPLKSSPLTWVSNTV